MNETYEIGSIGFDRYLSVKGIDFGSKNRIGLKMIDETPTHFLCKKNGQTYFGGIGRVNYSPSSYIIFRKGKNCMLETVHSRNEIQYNKKTAKEAKEKAVKLLKELSETAMQEVKNV